MKVQTKESPKQFSPFTIEIIFENLTEAKDTARSLETVLEDASFDLDDILDLLLTKIKQNVETCIKQFEL
jgi:hypothetical protein